VDDETLTKPKEQRQQQTPSPPPPIIQSSIPKDWTGKPPKEYLVELCQKRKYSKPIYQKVRGDGCTVTIRFSQSTKTATKTKTNHKTVAPEQPPLIITNPGPFASFNDAQHYTSTQALYKLNPTLPIYLLFPPIHRDL